MKILLADAHGPVRGKPQASPNLGLLYLASYIRSRMEDVEIRYVPQRYELNEHERIIEETRPDIYAMSFTSYGARVAYKSIERLKARFPHLPIVCGGPHPSSSPRDVLEKTAADICVLGEGEVTLTEIAQKRDNLLGERHSIKGIAYIKDGEYHETPPRPLIPDLDSIPFPSRDLIDDKDYVGSSLRNAAPDTEMIITRGCPLRCVFCANPVFRLQGPPFRKRSPERIAQEVELLYQMGYREIYLHSDELNVQHGWSVEVCKALAALGHSDLYFQANLRVSPMTPELARWLRKANFWMIRFGIESASERVLKGIKKKTSIEKTEYALRLMKEERIKVFGFFMMYQIWENECGVLEHETQEEVNQTLKYVWNLWRKDLLHYISWAVATPVQGAEMYGIGLRHGLINSDYYPDEQWVVHERQPWIARRDYARTVRLGRMLQAAMAFRNGSINWNNWKTLLVKGKDLLLGAQTK